ncbi:Ribosomal_S7 domain-containing protein [Meloidogyne graminicola]|uniref:Ribosomal_S7 domain-containing protein n=1 Tax=Meloidogyne graminicola TaxID=189291 RepID=A0A8T0A6B8_9BILA|nr:Ribosomal_S7 domain-containing protein [Meloidogyne graminicola]
MNSSVLGRNLLSFSNNYFCKCFFNSSACKRSVFDPNSWCDPIVNIEQLNKPLPDDDPRRYLHPKQMHSNKTPVFYRSEIIDRMANIFMFRGKKELIRDEIYGALEIIKRIQYKKWLDEKDENKRAKIVLDPFEVANLAILNCRPIMELRPVGRTGTVYQVPYPISEHYSIFRALKMMREIARQKCKHAQNRFRVYLIFYSLIH